MDWLGLYLEEDLGDAARTDQPWQGDLTSAALFSGDDHGAARVVARQGGVVAGLAVATQLFSRLGVRAHPHVAEGDEVTPGAIAMAVEGPVQGILAGERTALNIISRMSGIATRTRRLSGLAGTAVAGTRKTTPGFRRFEKEAIRIGGGDPHRMGLFDAMMVKDNHIAAAGDVAAAVAKLRAAHPDVLLEVEVESLEDALAAAGAGAHWLLIDNQDARTGRAWAEAVRRAHDVRIEASGGITEDTIHGYSWADRVSLGSLTLASLDFGLDWDPQEAV